MLTCSQKTELDSIIENLDEDQTGFMKGMYIGENIRNVLDIIQILEIENRSGFLLTLDFEKAFNSIN